MKTVEERVKELAEKSKALQSRPEFKHISDIANYLNNNSPYNFEYHPFGDDMSGKWIFGVSLEIDNSKKFRNGSVFKCKQIISFDSYLHSISKEEFFHGIEQDFIYQINEYYENN